MKINIQKRFWYSNLFPSTNGPQNTLSSVHLAYLLAFPGALERY